MQQNVFSISAKLKDLFPPDDPNSSWLVRLAILRDDFEYEVVPKGGRRDDGSGAWRGLYQTRKLAITVGEVRNIFAHDVTRHLEHMAGKWLPSDIAHLRDAIKAVEEAHEVLQPVRDGLGGHVRPQSASTEKGKPDRTPDVLRRHAEETIEVVLDLNTSQETSFHGLTTMAFMLVWPDVDTQEEYARRRWQLHERFLASINAIRHGIDLIFALHWDERGLLKQP